ncbi:MAG: plasmid stabilization protein [Candidatus Omnitrophota bacterium]|jgi:plasmid stability protein|nr:MAG: plasmid stabilization protein [Candidatus Omnitrophota bacterium]
MGELLIKDLDERLIHQLQNRASARHASLEEEVRDILMEAIKPPINELAKKATAFRERTAERQKTNSLDLLREDRTI